MIVLASLSSAQKAGIIVCFRNVIVTANLAASLAANSWTGGKLEQTISQCIIAINFTMLMTHVTAVDVLH